MKAYERLCQEAKQRGLWLELTSTGKVLQRLQVRKPRGNVIAHLPVASVDDLEDAARSLLHRLKTDYREAA